MTTKSKLNTERRGDMKSAAYRESAVDQCFSSVLVGLREAREGCSGEMRVVGQKVRGMENRAGLHSLIKVTNT